MILAIAATKGPGCSKGCRGAIVVDKSSWLPSVLNEQATKTLPGRASRQKSQLTIIAGVLADRANAKSPLQRLLTITEQRDRSKGLSFKQTTFRHVRTGTRAANAWRVFLDGGRQNIARVQRYHCALIVSMCHPVASRSERKQKIL